MKAKLAKAQAWVDAHYSESLYSDIERRIALSAYYAGLVDNQDEIGRMA